MAVIHHRGTIVRVRDVPDPSGRNLKTRPVVLVNDLDSDDAYLFGVAVTTTFDDPIPDTQIELPFARHGRCRTGLNSPNVAVCTWIVQVPPVDIIERMGHTPPIPLTAILERVARVIGG